MLNNPAVIAAILMLVLLFLKVPVFASVISATAAYFFLNPSLPQQIMAQRMFSGIESIPMLAIPFFVCAGVLMNYSGVTRRIMNFCEVLTGRMNGGLAQVNTLLSTLMGGLSGSNLADAAMEAKMLVPEMERKGFSKEFSSVVTAVSAMITPLIPPGIAMIVYGSVANVSIGNLFIAGIGPGVLLCAAMLILNAQISKRRGYVPLRKTRVSGKEFWAALKPALLPLMLPIIIIGGIRIGAFTPTEAGSVAIIYALILGVIYKELTWKSFLHCLKETITTTASIMIIIAAASGLAWILTREQIPQKLTTYIVTVIHNKYVFLLAVNLFLLFVGMLIEGTAAMIVLVPLLVPVARAYGINDIQFGLTVIFNMSIGCITPPMGTLMFVTCGITKCKIKDFIREAGPYYVLLAVCLLLITFVPWFTTGVLKIFGIG